MKFKCVDSDQVNIAYQETQAQSFENLKASQTKKPLHKNLSALNYYRNVILKFTKYLAPLYQKLKKTIKFLPGKNT